MIEEYSVAKQWKKAQSQALLRSLHIKLNLARV